MMIIESIKERAKLNKKKIILPEINDERVLEAASIITKEDIADIIMIGNEDEINKAKNKFTLDKVSFINPNTFPYIDKLINTYYEERKHKGISFEEAVNTIKNDYMYFSCMLVKSGFADGIVSGASHSSADVIRPALQTIRNKATTKLVSAFFLMEVPNCEYGENGVFIFADSGLNQYPNSEELSHIAVNSAESFKLLVDKEPKVAMISHSTKGSAKHDNVNKIINATELAKKVNPNLKIDGELQADAAIVPEVAKIKCPDSEVAGKANVLIFPDLDAGNNAYKLVERLAKAKAYGPITQGMNYPVNDLSRGCNALDIVGVVAITVVQAQKN
ncbi:MAG: phosphate acetyltransferase [Bacilli bacterium]|nr:phosphate acetyltransferase [Bacilli bacterium]